MSKGDVTHVTGWTAPSWDFGLLSSHERSKKLYRGKPIGAEIWSHDVRRQNRDNLKLLSLRKSRLEIPCCLLCHNLAFDIHLQETLSLAHDLTPMTLISYAIGGQGSFSWTPDTCGATGDDTATDTVGFACSEHTEGSIDSRSNVFVLCLENGNRRGDMDNKSRTSDGSRKRGFVSQIGLDELKLTEKLFAKCLSDWRNLGLI